MPNPNLAAEGEPYRFKEGNPGGPGRPKINLTTQEFTDKFVTNEPVPVPVVKKKARDYGLARTKVEELYAAAKHEKLFYVWRAPGGANEHLACLKPESSFPQKAMEQRPPIISLKEFLKRLRIKTDRRVIGLEFDDWQKRDFFRMAPAFVQLATGKPQQEAYKYHWKEYPKGHSKTADTAILTAYAMSQSVIPLFAVCAAGDVDQAAHLKNALEILQEYNPWLGLTIKVDRVECQHSGSVLKILTSDAPTSHGPIPDLVICDEFSHWKDAAQPFWASMFASVGKQDSAVIVVLTNAGFKGSWQFPLRNTFEVSPAWCFMRLEGPCASWMNPKMLESMKEGMIDAEYQRLWMNVWAEGVGDALRWEDVQAAIIPGLAPMAGPESGWEIFGGGDLAKRNDHASLALIARNMRTGIIRLARLVWWRPPIDLDVVKETLVSLDRLFHPSVWFIDPHQAELMIEQLMTQGINCEPTWFTGKNNLEMASSMVEVFTGRQIQLYREDMLLKDLSRLRIVGGVTGYKLDAPRTADGHCDRATALALALLAARRSELAMDGEYLTEAASASAWQGQHAKEMGIDLREQESFTPNWG